MLREHFSYIFEAAPLFGGGASAPTPQVPSPQGQAQQPPTSMSGEQLAPQDIRLARTVIQSVTQDLMSSGIQVGSLLNHLSGGMQLQDWNDLAQAVSLWIDSNPGTGGQQAQVRALQQKVRSMIGGYR